MIEQAYNALSVALRQDRTPRLVIILNLRCVKQQGMPDEFFDEMGAMFAAFEETPGAWSRIGRYEFVAAPILVERAALDFTMALRQALRRLHAKFQQSHSLGELDQAKALQPFSWPARKAEVNELLKGMIDAPSAEDGWRPLCMQDIQSLADLLPAIPAAEWFSRIMASQTVMFLDHTQTPRPWTREYFCRIAQVRQLIDPGIDLRGNDLLFAVLLGQLDLKVLEAASHWADEGRWSINLSINTLLSREFAVFADTHDLKGGMVEIKQSDLMLQYHRGCKAIAALREAGAAVAIDLVWADSLGVVAFDRIPGVSAVKIPWKDDQAGRLEAERGTLRRFLAADIVPVLTRVDSEAGVEAGLKSGIRAYQGHYVSSTYGLTRDMAA